jgi:RHS repeat-associated protein
MGVPADRRGCAACALFGYSHNAAGNQIGAAVDVDGASDNGDIAYAYDALGRLLTYGPDDEDQHQSYSWDALPDRRSITKGSGPTQSVSYDAASRPVADSSHASDGQGRVTQTPGSHANEVLTLSWSPIGRLTAVSSSLGGSTAYTYDPLDRLATISSGGTTTSFLYVGLTDAVARTVTTTASTTTTTQYVSDFEGSVLFEYDATALEPIFLGRNAHGDVTWSYGSNGAPSGHATYDPFANVAGSATVPAGIRWQGSWEDTTTGLYYVVARWYDPLSGRFLSEDPMEQDVERPQDRDPYAYGAGDQVNLTDPTGMCGGPGGEGQAPCSYSLDTSFAGFIYEPSSWYYICGAGAMRVVLAFSGRNVNWRQSKYYSYGKSNNYNSTTHLWSASKSWWYWQASDPHGQNYMLYLASKVVTFTTTYGVSSDPPNVATWLNRESGGSGFSVALSGASRSYYAQKSHASQLATVKNNFFSSLVKSIWKYNVPAMVAAEMDLLPSQTMAKRGPNYMHWIAVVGYDPTYFYYVDTCWGATLCGHPAPDGSLRARFDPNQPVTRPDPYLSTSGTPHGWMNFEGGTSLDYRFAHPGTWRISRNDLWNAMWKPSSGAYIANSGVYASSLQGLFAR